MPSFLCWLPYNLLIHLGLKATIWVPEYLRNWTSRFNTCGNWRHYIVFAFPLHFLFHCHVFYSFPLLPCPYLERAEISFRFLPHLSSWRLCILLLIDSHVWVMAKMECLISLTNHLHPHFCPLSQPCHASATGDSSLGVASSHKWPVLLKCLCQLRIKLVDGRLTFH